MNFRTSRFALFLCTCCSIGCAAPPPPKVAGTQSSAPASSTAAPADIDRTRAFLSLDQIEPKVEAPRKPLALAPLPDRAVEPIAASEKLIAQQRYTEAALELERALRYAPSHPEIHAHLATLHWQAGNLERAKSHAALAIEGNPQSVVGHYVLARSLVAAGDRPGAMAELRTAIACAGFGSDLEIAALIHFHLAEMLSAEGYLAAAIEQYEAFGRTASKSAPTPKGELASLLATRRGSVDQAKADILEKLGRFEDAAAILRPLAERTPEDVALHVRLARLLLAANRPDQAAAALNNIKTDDEKVIDLLIEIRQKAGQSDSVIEDLRARVKAKPDSAHLVQRLAALLLEKNRTDEAYGLLADFLSRHPDHAAIGQAQLDLLVRTQRWDEALKLSAAKLRNDPSGEKDVESILQAVRSSPSATDAIIQSAAGSTDHLHLYLIGRVAVDAGKWDDAERIFRQAIQIDSRFPAVRAALAQLLVRRCSLDEARQIAARTDPETPEDARLERALGRIHDRLGDLEKAELHYRTAAQLNRADTESMLALANIYRRTKKPLQAQRQIRALLEIDPTHDLARETLAVALLEDGKSEAASQEYVQLEKAAKKATTRARARIMLDPSLRGKPEQRRQMLLAAIETDGPDAPAYAALAETYEDSDLQKAREYYAKAAALDPEDEEPLLGMLRADQYDLQFDRVAGGFEQMLQCRPNRHAWRRMLIGMYSLLDDFDRAVGLAAQHAARSDLDPARLVEYREILVETLRESGRRDEAIEKLKEWAAQDSEGKEWTQRLAAEYMRQRKYKEAVATYEGLYTIVPDNRAIRDRLLDALEEAKQYTRAQQYLVEWFAEDPENLFPIVRLARTLSRSGQVDQGIELLTSWLAGTSRRKLLQDVWVSELAAAGRYDECAQLLDELADEIMSIMRTGGDPSRMPNPQQLPEERRIRLPDEPFAVSTLNDRFEDLRLARIYALTNARQFREAQELLDNFAQTDRSPELQMQLLARQANLYRNEGKEDQAVAVLKSALESSHTMRLNTESLSNDVAYSWIDRGQRLEEAEKLIRHAVGRVPRQAAYLDTYGWLLYKKGDFEGALRWLSRANRVRGGDDPVIHDHLGDVHWRLGQRDAAIERWTAAVALVEDRADHELTNDDERRVKRTTQQKISDAQAAQQPKIAALGGEPATPGQGEAPAEP